MVNRFTYVLSLRPPTRVDGAQTERQKCKQYFKDYSLLFSKDTNFPVAIGSRKHPFPFRTRPLSSSPPMVLHGSLCGRVGDCRVSFLGGVRHAAQPRAERQSPVLRTLP